MSRAALLPSTGDPYILLHCVKYFEEVWQDEVDKLYISICSTVDPGTIDNLVEILGRKQKIEVIRLDHGTTHGQGIDLLLTECKEDYILLVETDAIIYSRGIVDQYFSQIESGEYDLIGSERSSCTPNIIDIARKRWNLNFSGIGDHGPIFWPCFLWISKEHMLATDRNFGNYGWQPGEKLFDTVLTQEAAGDTFVWASLQFREMGLKILNVPQHHCHPMDINRVVTSWGALNPIAKFMHMGSLSSGIKNTLLDKNLIALCDQNNGSATATSLYIPTSKDEKRELERRVAWWRESYKVISFPEDDFTRGYEHGLEHVIKTCDLSHNVLDQWIQVYKEKMNG